MNSTAPPPCMTKCTIECAIAGEDNIQVSGQAQRLRHVVVCSEILRVVFKPFKLVLACERYSRALEHIDVQYNLMQITVYAIDLAVFRPQQYSYPYKVSTADATTLNYRDSNVIGQWSLEWFAQSHYSNRCVVFGHDIFRNVILGSGAGMLK